MSCTRSKKFLLNSWKLYAIVDGGSTRPGKSMVALVGKLARSVVDVVQFRFPEEAHSFHYKWFAEAVGCLKGFGKGVIMNDRPELALALGADGVHLGAEDITPETARALLGGRYIIGSTIRDMRGYCEALERGSDYVAIGPCFRTPVKKGVPPVPPGKLRDVLRRSELPVFAIGGINASNVAKLTGLGARRIVASRYLTEKDVIARAHELRGKIEQLRGV